MVTMYKYLHTFILNFNAYSCRKVVEHRERVVQRCLDETNVVEKCRLYIYDWN